MDVEAKDLIQKDLGHAGEEMRVRELRALLERYAITPDKVIPRMEFLFTMFCRPCFPRGELVAVSGKAKSGKTFVSSMLMTLCFRDEVLAFRRAGRESLKVLWYDTEQSDESTQDILKNRVIPMIRGGSPPRLMEYSEELFRVFNVRGEFFQNRLPLLEVAIGDFAPDLVILDGIRDLVNDINDGVMAQNVIERLMRLASETRCCIVCVLHQNKAQEDKNLRGYIGTELKNKAFEVYECVKDENRVFSFTQTDTRKYDIVDKLRYVVDANGIPTEYTLEGCFGQRGYVPGPETEGRPDIVAKYLEGWNGNEPIVRLELLFRDALAGSNMMLEGNLRARVMDVARITTGPQFYKCLNGALRGGFILKSSDAQGHNYYRVNDKRVSTTSPVRGE